MESALLNFVKMLKVGTSLKSLSLFVREHWIPLFYSASNVASAVAQLVAGFLIIKWITPEELGYWQSVRLAQVYAFVLLVGINNGLSRELPFFLGKGDHLFSERLLATALYCTTIASMIVVVIGVACAFVFAGSGSNMVLAIMGITIIIPLTFYQNIFLATFRSLDSFNKLTVIEIANASVSLLSLVMVYFGGYKGMILRTVIMIIVLVWLMYAYLPMRVRMRMDREALKLLVKTGLPIFGLDYMKNSAATTDRVVLLSIGGVKEVGLYSLPSMALETLKVLPRALSTYVYPRMTFKYGQDGNAGALWKFGLKFVLLSMGASGLAAVFGWLILPRFVAAFAPKYIDAIPAAQIIIIAGILEGATIITSALWSMKAWKFMVTYQALGSIMYVLGPILGCFIVGRSMVGVAWGVAIGYLFQGISAFGLTYYRTRTG